MIRNMLWRLVASIVSRPAVFERLKKRAMRTPYTEIRGANGDLYMRRFWLFNPYRKDAQGGVIGGKWGWLGLPSIRLHHIMLPDVDRHLHDHPWNARTIVLDGWYGEVKPFTGLFGTKMLAGYSRERGYTGRLMFGEYHRITDVPFVGVWTMFFTWKYQGTWGFEVDGVKVPYKQYLAERGQEES